MKTVSITKEDLENIAVWSFVKGFVEGKNTKKDLPSKKGCKEVVTFVLNAYWYKKGDLK